MSGATAVTIIIIITVIKVNWPINLDQKDREQKPNPKRSISGSICAQLSPAPKPLYGANREGGVASYLEEGSKNFWNPLSSLPDQTQISQATQ